MNNIEWTARLTRVRKLHEDLAGEYFADSLPLKVEVFSDGMREIPPEQFEHLDYREIKTGENWGKLWESGYFRISGVIPEEWRGKNVSLEFNAGGEVLFFDRDKHILCGLTHTCVNAADYRKELFHFPDKVKGGESFVFYAECAANGLLGDEINFGGPGMRCPVGILHKARFGIFRHDVLALKLDLEVLLALFSENSDANRWYKVRSAYQLNGRGLKLMLRIMDEAVRVFDANPENAAAARKVLEKAFAKKALPFSSAVAAVGHAHIDTAWLWPMRESVRKCARTFANQLDLLDRYPSYVFGASQALHYAWVKERYPELFERVKHYVKEGRWELSGAMWVESDCNLPSGESLIRQFFYGKRFFLDEFGIEVKILYLPDAFGYSGALPQIIKKSGCEYFVTQKLSWNDTSKFPYNAFIWRGIDGSSVLSCCPPEDNYNAKLTPDQLNYGEANFSANDICDEFLSLFGVGDGGGGPSSDYVERGLRCADLEGCPKVHFDTAEHFFERLEKHRDELPEWKNELYLQCHRGTFTTQNDVKSGNRRNEQNLIALEGIYSLADSAAVPQKEIDRLWKTLLANQFHDVIPGSSIGEVYQVTAREYREMEQKINQLLENFAADKLNADNEALTLVNTLSFTRKRRITLPEKFSGSDLEWKLNGRTIPLQLDADTGAAFIYLELPPWSITTLHREKKPAVEAVKVPEQAAAAKQLKLENDFMLYEFSPAGALTRAFDKRYQREVLGKSGGNRLKLYTDNPTDSDAWEIDKFYLENHFEEPEASGEVLFEAGSIYQALTFQLKIGSSHIRQRVILENFSAQLDFETRVDWHEKHKLLRTSFELAFNAETLDCEIPYGILRRPTVFNNFFEQPEYEVSAHRYADACDSGNYGAALLNNGKYGYSARRGMLDLALLRAPTYPDAEADLGCKDFAYSFLPHDGGIARGEVIEKAAALNREPVIFTGYSAGENLAFPFEVTDSKHVSLEVVKPGADGKNLVFRAVEIHGRGGFIKLKFSSDCVASEIFSCDLLERRQQKLTLQGDGTLSLELAPFEIFTFSIRKVR